MEKLNLSQQDRKDFEEFVAMVSGMIDSYGERWTTFADREVAQQCSLDYLKIAYLKECMSFLGLMLDSQRD